MGSRYSRPGHARFYLSSLLLLFSYDFNFLLGVFSFGGSFGAINREGLALLECARRIRDLAWDALTDFCTGCLSFALGCSIHLFICFYCISVYCLFIGKMTTLMIPLHCVPLLPILQAMVGLPSIRAQAFYLPTTCLSALCRCC
jgi:hypothetical protein